MYEAAASCKNVARTPVTNWESHGVTLAEYCYAVRYGIKVQLVTPYRVSHLQRYGVTVRGNVTSVLDCRLHGISLRPLPDSLKPPQTRDLLPSYLNFVLHYNDE